MGDKRPGKRPKKGTGKAKKGSAEMAQEISPVSSPSRKPDK